MLKSLTNKPHNIRYVIRIVYSNSSFRMTRVMFRWYLLSHFKRIINFRKGHIERYPYAIGISIYGYKINPFNFICDIIFSKILYYGRIKFLYFL